MGAVGLVFAPLAPLVAVAAAIVFWIGSWVYKYQLMFVFVSKVESGGVRVFLALTSVVISDIPTDCSVFGTSPSTACSFPQF